MHSQIDLYLHDIPLFVHNMSGEHVMNRFPSLVLHLQGHGGHYFISVNVACEVLKEFMHEHM